MAAARRGDRGQLVARSVLIVEDEAILASNIREYLERHRYEVRVAASIADGMRQLEERRPDVVLLDILLPDGDGRRILRRIRDGDANVGIIIMTAFGGIQLALDAMAAGADDYVEKPVPLDSLKLLIDRLIDENHPPAGSC
jgi:DNA-binding response OmpR family regulator